MTYFTSPIEEQIVVHQDRKRTRSKRKTITDSANKYTITKLINIPWIGIGDTMTREELWEFIEEGVEVIIE